MRDIPPFDTDTAAAARARQAGLVKPPGSLGRLEDLSVRLAGMPGRLDWIPERRAVIICAGDHGVTAQGVSAYPQTITARMVETFIAGRAAISAVAQAVGAKVMVVDAGVRARYDMPPEATGVLVAAPIGRGTRDFTEQTALKPGEDSSALQLGLRVVERLIAVDEGQLIAVGEMGIGNATAASAIIAAISGQPASWVTGRGTGVSDEGLARKIDVVERALAHHQPAAEDTLLKFGGYEIGAMAGIMIGAAAQRIPVIVDGLISSAAALIAMQHAPAVRDYLIAGHRSTEPGHQVALDVLGLEPLLDLDMRLGEGTGAALAIPVVEAAARTLAQMGTLSDLGR
ncbi:MAG: nicotinate-nucleotide--dimethylbenzimidazole phosphoribosyltransferase [Anaerolineae bacterium]